MINLIKIFFSSSLQIFAAECFFECFFLHSPLLDIKTFGSLMQADKMPWVVFGSSRQGKEIRINGGSWNRLQTIASTQSHGHGGQVSEFPSFHAGQMKTNNPCKSGTFDARPALIRPVTDRPWHVLLVVCGALETKTVASS